MKQSFIQEMHNKWTEVKNYAAHDTETCTTKNFWDWLHNDIAVQSVCTGR
jgi:hypothetical protein